MRYTELEHQPGYNTEPSTSSNSIGTTATWRSTSTAPNKLITLDDQYGTTVITYQLSDRTEAFTFNYLPNADYSRTQIPLMNRCGPEELRISNHKDRHWITNRNTDKVWPFHPNYMLIRDGHNQWIPARRLPTPNPNGISRPVRHLVKEWAASYTPGEDRGLCGLCVMHDGVPMAAIVDDGAHQRQHILDHVLGRTLPHSLMWFIGNHMGHRGAPPVEATITSRTASYTNAVAFAYDQLRSANV